MPLMVALWPQGRGCKLLAVIGIAAATAIALSAGSSGPIMAYFAGVIGLAMWPIRRQMRWLRWGLSLTVICLQLVMKAPVWFLLARVSVFDASTGYHRANLIDQSIAHFSDWWLTGTTQYPYWGYHLFDRTNHYICLATDGGLLTLILFITILTRCYRNVGKVAREADRQRSRKGAWFAWVLGSALTIHAVGFISITYFDQNMVNWYLLLALIASASTVCLTKSTGIKGGKPSERALAGERVEIPAGTWF